MLNTRNGWERRQLPSYNTYSGLRREWDKASISCQRFRTLLDVCHTFLDVCHTLIDVCHILHYIYHNMHACHVFYDICHTPSISVTPLLSYSPQYLSHHSCHTLHDLCYILHNFCHTHKDSHHSLIDIFHSTIPIGSKWNWYHNRTAIIMYSVKQRQTSHTSPDMRPNIRARAPNTL